MPARDIMIAPSILSANFRCLEREVKAAEDAGADMIHCDIMDGNFVPNITFGPLVVEAVRACVSIPLDVHLMISHPEKYIERFRSAGADIITVHAETTPDVGGVIEQIRAAGARVGVTVNPDKPVDLLLPHLAEIDQVLIMTVYAGFGGQKFMADMMAKVRRVYDEAIAIGRHIDIEVDGGVNDETAAVCTGNGANVLVAGNYVFNSDDYAARIEAVRSSGAKGQASL